MSFPAMTWAIQQSVGGSDKLVLLLVAYRINPDHGFCWPSIEKITEDSGLSYSTVQRSIASLVQKGLLVTQRTRTEEGYLSGFRFYIPDDFVSPGWREITPSGQNDRAAPSGQIRPAYRSNTANPSGQNDRTIKVKHKLKEKGNITPLPPKPPKTNIPDWIPLEAWNGFLEMRASIKKPLKTEYAVSRIVKALERLRDQGNDPADVLDQSTMNSYQGVFPVKGDAGSKPQRRLSLHDQFENSVPRITDPRYDHL